MLNREGLFMLERIGTALTPFLWGGVLALLLNIPLCRLEAHLGALRPGLRRVLALSAVMVGLAAALLLGVWLLIPQLTAAVSDLAAALPRLAEQAGQALGALGGTGGGKALPNADGAAQLWQAGLNAAKDTAGALGQLVLAVALAAYLLAGKEKNLRTAHRAARALLGEEKAAHAAALCRRAASVFSGFIAGQCLEACILAGLFVLVLFVCRMPSVLPISAVIGVTALIPVFGAWVGCGIGVLLILPVSLEKAGWFLVLFFCVQQFENNVIYPRVVGSRIGLPPLWVLSAVLLGGGLFGAAGLLLGIPAMSVLYRMGGEWVEARLKGEKTGPKSRNPMLDSLKKM